MTIKPLYSTELIAKSCITQAATTVVAVRLLNSDGSILARASDWPQPLKYLKLTRPDIRPTVSQDQVRITTDRPVKVVCLMQRKSDRISKWTDNGFDLFPGNDRTIGCAGIQEGDHVETRFLGD